MLASSWSPGPELPGGTGADLAEGPCRSPDVERPALSARCLQLDAQAESQRVEECLQAAELQVAVLEHPVEVLAVELLAVLLASLARLLGGVETRSVRCSSRVPSVPY